MKEITKYVLKYFFYSLALMIIVFVASYLTNMKWVLYVGNSLGIIVLWVYAIFYYESDFDKKIQVESKKLFEDKKPKYELNKDEVVDMPRGRPPKVNGEKVVIGDDQKRLIDPQELKIIKEEAMGVHVEDVSSSEEEEFLKIKDQLRSVNTQIDLLNSQIILLNKKKEEWTQKKVSLKGKLVALVDKMEV